MIHRASGFKSNALKDLFDAGYKASNIFEPFADHKVSPALKKLSDEGKFPCLSEGIAYFELVRSFVREWLDESGDAVSDDFAKGFYNEVKESPPKVRSMSFLPFETDDNAMVNLISQMIFCVRPLITSLWVGLYRHCPPSQQGAPSAALRTEHRWMLSVILNVNRDRWNRVCPESIPHARVRELLWVREEPPCGRETFGLTLWVSQSVAVQMPKREVEFKAFDPARFECFVSV